MHNLTPQEMCALQAFKERMLRLLGEANVFDCILFGSRARGEGNENSDLDLLVLVDESVMHQRGTVYGLSGEILVEYGIDVSPLVMSRKQFESMQQRERLFPQEIEQDGQRL